jgi:uncharacterized protein YndB with AHSA1/START domain
MKITNTVDIKATPAEVFPWLEDPERGKRWMTSVAGGDFIRKTPEKVGSTFLEYVQEGGRRIEIHGVITDYRANECFAVHVESDRHMADVKFTLAGNLGITRLTQQIELRLKGFSRIASIFLRPVIKKSVENQSRKEFATLKRLCETGSRSGGEL